MAENNIRVVARIQAREEKTEDVSRLLTGLIEPTRREPGCVSYELLENREDPTDFTFVEEWTDADAFARHFETAHIRNALPQLKDLTAADPDIRTYRVIG